MFHNEFFPTPELALELMNLDVYGKVILDPSAGSGNILDYAKKHFAKKTLAIEITDELRQIVGSKHELIGKDFFDIKEEDLSHIDMIIMNPPFSNADKHILKAWEVAPGGCEIVAICNSQTIENDYSRTRKQLLTTINNYGNCQNIGQLFTEAERKTDVEISLIKLFKPKRGNDFNFEGFFMEEDEVQIEQEGLQRYDEVKALVNRYIGAIKKFDTMYTELENLNNLTSQLGMSKLELELSRNERIMDRDSFAKTIQKRSWQYIFRKMNLEKFVTSGVMKDINKFVEQQTKYPFTMKNIYKMFEIIIGTREQTFNRALEEAIDKITMHTHENRYQVEGWKTNSGYMLNEKFIVENIVGFNFSSDLKVKYDSYGVNKIDDLIKVICQIMGHNYSKIGIMHNYFNSQHITPNKWYDFVFFYVKFFKKGTAHFKFKEKDTWYRVNQSYAKIKGFTLHHENK